MHHWAREESLSQITQVEVLDPSLIQHSSLDFAAEDVIRQMQEPVSLVEIPARII